MNKHIPTPKSDYFRGKGPTILESSYTDEILKSFAETERKLYLADEKVKLLEEALKPNIVEKSEEPVYNSSHITLFAFFVYLFFVGFITINIVEVVSILFIFLFFCYCMWQQSKLQEKEGVKTIDRKLYSIAPRVSAEEE